MTVHELLQAILKAYAGATADALATHKPAFYARFERREGPHLAAAFTETLATFKPTARQPFPIPADIEPHMPSLAADNPSLDLKGHADRKRRLLEEWRQAQGYRGANGVSRVMQALEFIAEPIAHQRAWAANPEPVRLTRAQLVLAQQRAVSSERRARHEHDPRPERMSADAWWAQIDAIQREWNIPLVREDWTAQPTKGDERRAA